MTTTKPRRKRKPGPIHATYDRSSEEPDWIPLLYTVGPFLIRWFGYFGGYRLKDGTRIHLYRHADTREYLHIHDDLRCFVYNQNETYLEVARRHLVFRAFGDYGCFPSESEEGFDRYRDAVRVAEHLAWLRDQDPEGEAPPNRPLASKSVYVWE